MMMVPSHSMYNDGIDALCTGLRILVMLHSDFTVFDFPLTADFVFARIILINAGPSACGPLPAVFAH